MFILLATNLALVHSTAFASSKEEKRAEKVKEGIRKLGTGKDATVMVKLIDGTKLRGYISEARTHSFVVFNETTGVGIEVSYSKAKQVKGHNLSTGVKIAIVIGVIFVVGLLYALLNPNGGA